TGAAPQRSWLAHHLRSLLPPTIFRPVAVHLTLWTLIRPLRPANTTEREDAWLWRLVDKCGRCTPTYRPCRSSRCPTRTSTSGILREVVQDAAQAVKHVFSSSGTTEPPDRRPDDAA